MRFLNETAIVTGGGSGIGRATVLELACQGAAVAILDLDLARAAAVSEEVRHADGRAHAYHVDVTDLAAMRQAAEAAAGQLGPISVLVSNAGWDVAMPFIETKEELWDKVIAINYRGHLAATQAVLPQMIEQGRGRIVTVASDAGRVGSSGEAVYSGAKGAVIAFTKALAREVARSGIAVNCVAPGLTDTPFLDRMIEENEKLINAILHAIPMRRFAKPEEVAKAIAFLASADATYITGQTLSVNGGLSMV